MDCSRFSTDELRVIVRFLAIAFVENPRLRMIGFLATDAQEELHLRVSRKAISNTADPA